MDWFLVLHFAIWNSAATIWDDNFRTWDAIIDENWRAISTQEWHTDSPKVWFEDV